MSDLKKIVLCGLAFAVIALFVHSVGAFLLMDYYTSSTQYCLWSKIMMPANAAPGIEFFAYSFLFSAVTGMLFAYVYLIIKTAFVEKTIFHKGIKYGLLLFLVAGVPSYLSLFLLIAIPAPLLAAWAVEDLALLVIGGLLCAKIVENECACCRQPDEKRKEKQAAAPVLAKKTSAAKKRILKKS